MALRLSYWPVLHPIQRYHQSRIHLEPVGRRQQLSFDVVVVCFLVIRYEPDVLKQLAELRWENAGWKQLLWLDFILVVHHLFKAFLVGFVSPWELSETEVAQKKQQRLDVVLFEVLLVWQVGCQSSVHGSAHHSEVVLLFGHVLLQGLQGALLFSCFRVNQILPLIFGWLVCLRRVGTVLFLGQPKIDQVYEMCLSRIVSNDHVGWFQVSVDVALGVDAVEPVHQLQGYNDDCLDIELALLQRFLELL